MVKRLFARTRCRSDVGRLGSLTISGSPFSNASSGVERLGGVLFELDKGWGDLVKPEHVGGASRPSADDLFEVTMVAETKFGNRVGRSRASQICAVPSWSLGPRGELMRNPMVF